MHIDFPQHTIDSITRQLNALGVEAPQGINWSLIPDRLEYKIGASLGVAAYEDILDVLSGLYPDLSLDGMNLEALSSTVLAEVLARPIDVYHIGRKWNLLSGQGTPTEQGTELSSNAEFTARLARACSDAVDFLRSQPTIFTLLILVRSNIDIAAKVSTLQKIIVRDLHMTLIFDKTKVDGYGNQDNHATITGENEIRFDGVGLFVDTEYMHEAVSLLIYQMLWASKSVNTGDVQRAKAEVDSCPELDIVAIIDFLAENTDLGNIFPQIDPNNQMLQRTLTRNLWFGSQAPS